MKTKTLALITALCGLAIVPPLHAQAAEPHAHSHEKKEAGPNEGRIFTSTDPHFEFFVTPERKIKITFLGEDKKPIAPKQQTVTAVGGDRANPTKLTFVRDGDSLVSEQALNDVKEQPIILHLKPTPDAKAVVERFNVNLAVCPECKHKEYACICEHDH